MQSRTFPSRRRANAPTFTLYDDHHLHQQDSCEDGVQPSAAAAAAQPAGFSTPLLGFQSPRFEELELKAREAHSSCRSPIRHSPTVTKNLSDYFRDAASGASFAQTFDHAHTTTASNSSRHSRHSPPHQRRHCRRPAARFGFASASSSSSSSSGDAPGPQRQHSSGLNCRNEHNNNSSSSSDSEDEDDEHDEASSASSSQSSRCHHRSASETAEDPRITRLFRSIPWATVEGRSIYLNSSSNNNNCNESADFKRKLATVVLDQRSPDETIKAWQSSGPFPPVDPDNDDDPETRS